MNKFMKAAVAQARFGMTNGHGGPFGAAVVKDDEIISCSHNQVLSTNDPTMHAEIAVIREACSKLGRFDLGDCEIYSTCMPCPMCLSAIIWAKIPKLYYGALDVDAAQAGFDDEYIYDYIRKGSKDETKLSTRIIDTEECRVLFDDWMKKDDRMMY